MTLIFYNVEVNVKNIYKYIAVANEIYGLIPIMTNPGPNSILAPTPEKAQIMPPRNPKIDIKIMSLFDP